MSELLRRLRSSLLHQTPRPSASRSITRQPEPPLGFVRRSDPSYYYLVRSRQEG